MMQDIGAPGSKQRLWHLAGELRYTFFAASAVLALLAIMQAATQTWFMFAWDGIACLVMFSLAILSSRRNR